MNHMIWVQTVAICLAPLVALIPFKCLFVTFYRFQSRAIIHTTSNNPPLDRNERPL